MTVRDEEDCSTIVMPVPRRRLKNQFEVSFLSACSILPPAIFSSPEDMTLIP